MKNIFYTYQILLLAIFLFGCTNNSSVVEKEIPIRFQENGELNLSSICNSVRYVKLTTEGRDFIGSINKIIVSKGNIYILDRKLMKIFAFNQNGLLIATLNAKGRGPGEYNYIADFLIDPVNQNIEILDDGNAKILTYDSNFKFISERKKKGHASVFSKFDKDTYIFFA